MVPMYPDDFGQEGTPDTGNPIDLSTLFGANGVTFEEQARGTGVFEMGPGGQMVEVYPEDDLMTADRTPQFAENIAEILDEDAQAKIAADLIERIEEDIQSRKPWAERYQDGMRMMGLIKDEVDDGPFPGASTAVMPIIAEAVVQFWARSLAEQAPAEGPAKTKVNGKPSAAVNARAERVADYMNYDIMLVDKTWFSDHSRMLFALPQEASTFKKIYRDQALGRNASEYVQAEDFICNYAFRDLETAPRYTHRIWKTANEVKKAQVAGIYRDVELGDAPDEELSEETQVRLEASDFEADEGATKDSRHELFECYCELDLPGEFADPDGIARPYIVTLDAKSHKILAIYRGWKEADPLKRRRVVFVKYDFLPGPGFYGLGLFHLIGGLQQAATGALRLLIDGSATASLQGGFISKDASLKDENLSIEPGVWKQVDATADDLAKAFYTPPMKEPSPQLFQVLGTLIQRSEKFAATTEMMTGGENAKNAPVGSTMALLEMGGKVFSTIHRGLHMSLGAELRCRSDLIQEYMPVEGYPYDVDGNHQGLLAEDFAPGVQVVPVSDPNIFSSTQRVALNQAVYTMGKENPGILDMPTIVRRVLEGLKVPDIDELFAKQAEPPAPMDPVSEIQALLRGQPVQPYPDQNHVAHLQHYAAFMANPQYGGNPELQKQIGPAAMALIGQRLGYAWAAANRQLGVPAPMLPPPLGQAQGPTGQPNSPEQNQGGMPQPMGPQGTQNGPQELPPAPPEVIAQMAAQFMPQLAQVPGFPSLDGGQGDPAGQAKAEAITAESQLKIAAGQQQIQQNQELHAQKIEMANRKADLEIGVKEAAAALKMEKDARKAEQEAMLQEQAAMQDQQRMATEALNQERQAILEAQEAARQDEAHQQELATQAVLAQQELTQEAERQEQEQRIKEQDALVRQQATKAKAKATAKPKAGKKP